MDDDTQQKTHPATLDVPDFLKNYSSERYRGIQIRSAPLPTPEELQGYEIICPGAAERIIRMAERQGEHRRNLENKAVTAAIIDGHIGLFCAFIVSIIGLICGYFLIISGYSIVGSVFSGMSFFSIVKAFLDTNNRTSSNKKNKKQK